MRLTLDLRSAYINDAQEGEPRIVLVELPAALRPRRLAALLRPRHHAITIELDALPPSAVQGAGLLLGVLLRSRRVDLVRDGSAKRVRKPSLLARGIAAVVVGVPRELGALLAVRIRLIRLGRPSPIRPPSSCGRILYLRAHPTLRFGGHYAGGAATHTTGVINGLTANDVRVEVLAAEAPEGIGDAPVTLVPPRRAHHLVSWLTTSNVASRLVRTADGRQVDAVYERCTLGSTAGLGVATRLGIPLVLEFNSSELWTGVHWGTGRLPLRRLAADIEQRSLEGGALIVVVSRVMKEELIGRGIPAERILVNPNGVDLGKLAPYRERVASAWRARLGLPDGPTVGFIGTFGRFHGTELVPAIAARVQADHPDARWLLIGGGQHQEQVRRDAEAKGLAGRILMPGMVPRERGLELLAACDVCISPHVPNPDGTRFFGSPTKLFEYMGLQKAIVAARLEQIGEVLEHGVTALLHEPGDVTGAADHITALLSDPDARQRLGDAALAEAQRRYTWQAHSRRILDALVGQRG